MAPELCAHCDVGTPAMPEPASADAGFTDEHRRLFTQWLSGTNFKSVVLREHFTARHRVLQGLADGRSARKLAEDGVGSLTFVQKTRQNYSVDEHGDLHYHARKGKGALLVIPNDEIFDVIVREHNAVHHQGTSKTWYEISSRYHGIPKRAVDWVLQRCMLCHAHRPGPRPAPTQPIPSHHVMERVQMDLIDMRKEPDGKFRWILHIKDHYSRFCMLYPLRHRNEREVMYCFLQWIAVMGPPTILQMDNGTEFVNALLSQVAVQHQILIRHSQAGRPRSQGLVERANGHVRMLIAKWCQRFQERQWARCLPTIAFTCNTSVHASTNKTPFEMVFARKTQWQRVRPPPSPSKAEIQACMPDVSLPRPTSPDAEEDAPLLGPIPPMPPPSSSSPTPTPPPSTPLLSRRRQTSVYPRGTRVSISIAGVDRSPLDPYRLPAVVLSHKRNKGYRVSTAWGILSKRIPARHVLPLPEGYTLPARALTYLHPGMAAKRRIKLADCIQKLQGASAAEETSSRLLPPSFTSMQLPPEAYESS